MHVPRANIEYTSRPRRSPWSSRRCRSLLAAVAEAIQKGMAGPLKAMNEQGEEIRRLQGQITALRIESKQSPSEGDGDRGARNKRARPPSAPTSPRERMQRGEWCLELNPFDVDNIKELTSAWGCASKLTLFLAGRRLTLLLEGASNPESNFHSLKAIVAFAHSQNLGVPCPELQASPHAPTTCTRPDAPAAHADAPSLPPVRQWTPPSSSASPPTTTSCSRRTSSPSSAVAISRRRAPWCSSSPRSARRSPPSSTRS